MGRIVVTEYLSVDGVMEAPNEWSGQFWKDEAAKFKFDELFAGDAILLGRVTYEGFAAAWPNYQDGAGFADRMNGLPKFVVSTTLQNPTWNNSTVISDNVAEAVSQLKQQFDGDILVEGSADLVKTLMQHGLVDEYRLMVHPVIVGHGKLLFSNGDEMKALRLTGTKVLDDAIIVLYYEPLQVE